LLEVLPAGGARNALDCALWDLEAKEHGRRVWELAALPLCADESFPDHSSFASLHSRYRVINIKLDKTGGLTEALHCAATAQARGLEMFAGNMLGTSLGMAPAFLLAPLCRWVDLDGPLLLARDREAAIRFDGPMMQPFGAEVWG